MKKLKKSSGKKRVTAVKSRDKPKSRSEWIVAIIVCVVIVFALGYFVYTLNPIEEQPNYTYESYPFLEELMPFIKDECTLKYLNLVNIELDENESKSCNRDSDCSTVFCNVCVNKKGKGRYDGLLKFCDPPQERCNTIEECYCIENICAKRQDE